MSSNSSGSGSGGGSAGGGAPQLAGMFAGGFPQLKKTGRQGAASMVGPGNAKPAPSSNPKPLMPQAAKPKSTSNISPVPASSLHKSAPAAAPMPQKRVASPRQVVTPPPLTPPPAASAGGEMFTVMYDYTAVKQGELTIRKNDIVTIAEKKASGWWKGTGTQGSCVGRTGLLPGNYCAPLQRCRAKYAYKAARSDELSFEKGDVIIVKKPGKNWWLGVLVKGGNSMTGAFPVDYTEVLDQ